MADTSLSAHYSLRSLSPTSSHLRRPIVSTSLTLAILEVLRMPIQRAAFKALIQQPFYLFQPPFESYTISDSIKSTATSWFILILMLPGLKDPNIRHRILLSSRIILVQLHESKPLILYNLVMS